MPWYELQTELNFADYDFIPKQINGTEEWKLFADKDYQAGRGKVVIRNKMSEDFTIEGSDSEAGHLSLGERMWVSRDHQHSSAAGRRL